MKQEMVRHRAYLLTQHLLQRTAVLRQGASVVGGHSLSLLRNLKIYTQAAAGYPRAIYIPFLLLSSAAYGFHSVKKTSRPLLPVDVNA
jgi:hypothetical protein